MLYFAYGSNLHHFQMKRRCKDSKFLKKINLKNFKLTFRSKYRAADIEPKKNSLVPGGLFDISKSDEKKLDIYEDYPILSKSINLRTVESEIAKSITEIQNNNFDVEIGSYPFFRAGKLGVSIVIRSPNKEKIDACEAEILELVKSKGIEIVEEV